MNIAWTRINVVVFGMYEWDIQGPDSAAQLEFLSRIARTVFYFSCMYSKLHAFYPHIIAARRNSCLPYRFQDTGRRYRGICKRCVGKFGPNAFVSEKIKDFASCL
jgi:hypothetical protein